jgi:MFS family permease
VLALASADTGAISAVAPQLEKSLHIGNVDVGLLVTAAAITAAVGMLPVGWVTDRWTRTRLVTAGVICWGVAELASAIAPDYPFLLAIRVSLGALTAVTGPTLASLTGDLFPARERSQIYGYILTGELLGAGLGLLVAGLFSAWFGWRVAFAVLSLPSALLAWQFHRHLPEPARGGQSRLEPGAERIVPAEEIEDRPTPAPSASGPPEESQDRITEETEVLRQVRRHRFDPHEGVVLDRDPLELGWWESFRYVVAVRSNVTLILASALGYFFFSGVETFALIYLEGHYGVGQGVATLITLSIGVAAIVGAVVGGRTTDRLLRDGHIGARMMVPAVAFAGAAVAFVPGILVTLLWVALPLFLFAGFLLATPNPGLDAARLDVMPSRMWGRAEAVRSLMRSVLQAFAPLLFGLLSTVFGGTESGLGSAGGRSASSSGAAGLEPTFLVMLATLAAAAVVVWRGRRSYPFDVAAADATERRFPATAD